MNDNVNKYSSSLCHSHLGNQGTFLSFQGDLVCKLLLCFCYNTMNGFYNCLIRIDNYAFDFLVCPLNIFCKWRFEILSLFYVIYVDSLISHTLLCKVIVKSFAKSADDHVQITANIIATSANPWHH